MTIYGPNLPGTAKFGRIWNLSVLGRSGNMISLQYPLTIRFAVSHAVFSGANNAKFQIYNLGAKTQKEIYWDNYIKATQIPIQFYAGYVPGAPPLVFNGTVNIAYTERSGQDLITYIDAVDGGFAIRNGVFTNFAIPAYTPFASAFSSAVAKGLPGVTTDPAQISFTYPPLSKTSVQILNGLAWNEIKEKLLRPGDQCGIADGVAYAVGLNDSLNVPSSIGTLSAGSGLLDIPKREGNLVTCRCLFEPRMKLNQTLDLISDRVPWVNGNYSIQGFDHQGTISGVESGDATTNINLVSTSAPKYPTFQGVTGPNTPVSTP